MYTASTLHVVVAALRGSCNNYMYYVGNYVGIIVISMNVCDIRMYRCTLYMYNVQDTLTQTCCLATSNIQYMYMCVGV